MSVPLKKTSTLNHFNRIDEESFLVYVFIAFAFVLHIFFTFPFDRTSEGVTNGTTVEIFKGFAKLDTLNDVNVLQCIHCND